MSIDEVLVPARGRGWKRFGGWPPGRSDVDSVAVLCGLASPPCLNAPTTGPCQCRLLSHLSARIRAAWRKDVQKSHRLPGRLIPGITIDRSNAKCPPVCAFLRSSPSVRVVETSRRIRSSALLPRASKGLCVSTPHPGAITEKPISAIDKSDRLDSCRPTSMVQREVRNAAKESLVLSFPPMAAASCQGTQST